MIPLSTLPRLALLGLGLCLASCAHKGGAAPLYPSDAERLYDGVAYWRAAPVADRPQIIHVLAIDLTRPGTKLMATPGDKSAGLEYRAQTVSSFVAKHKLQAGINGGYFLPFKGGSPGGDDYIPKAGDGANVSGAAWGAGQQASPIETDPTDKLNYDRRVVAIVCINNGKQVKIVDGQQCPESTEDAISAGPWLLKGGAPVATDPAAPPSIGDRTVGGPRTAIGTSRDGRKVWLVVVDGRQLGVSEGASTGELKKIFTLLGAHDALNLDGGGSSTMVAMTADGRPKVMNSPIHTGVPGRERPSANHLGVYAKPVRK
jgi:hypothetical protein